MEFQLEKDPVGYRISSFFDNAVLIGEIRYTESLIVTPERVIGHWPPKSPHQLTIADIGEILVLEPELILVGTGNSFLFPDSLAIKGAVRAGISIDFMDSRAVCRTYNVLASEGRRVAAGIIIDQ